MAKTTITYWNPLSSVNEGKWQAIDGLEGIAEELTLITRLHPGADTTPFGGKSHEYPEEIFVISGRLYDQAFDVWLETGHYTSRPPGEVHGPFKTDIGCTVLELSFPNKVSE